MNYKKIIKSRTLRIKLLQALSFIPDKLMLRIQYKIKTGRKLNLKNPQRFSEKLQWYKLNYRDGLMPSCVDKFDVRLFVSECGFKDNLTECYGVYDSPNDIDFEKLPNAFVLKDTLGGGGNSVIIVRNKAEADINDIKRNLEKWVNEPITKKNPGREWVYDNKKHRIIIEEYLSEPNNVLSDYKFFCFDGKIACVYVISNRKIGGHGELAIMDSDFKRLPYQSMTQEVMKEDPLRPIVFDDMKRIAERLSEKFPHVRVDLYALGTRIVFGELTFFGASGYMKYDPDDFDYILGEKFSVMR